MIKLFKTDFHTIAAALTLGALSIGITPAAMAVSTYDAAASFSLTLTNVTDLAGTQVTSGWEVSAISDPFEQSDVIGAATASVTNIVDPGTPISILDTILTSSTASGTASNGTGSSTGDIGLDILASNFSGQALSFSFTYEAIASTMTLGDATAETVVDILDDLGSVSFSAASDTASGPLPGDTGNGLLTLSGIINFDLLDGEFNNISGFVFSFGQATAVPVPAAVWLFGSGLLGLVGIARRRKAA